MTISFLLLPILFLSLSSCILSFSLLHLVALACSVARRSTTAREGINSKRCFLFGLVLVCTSSREETVLGYRLYGLGGDGIDARELVS
jgi:hypothetical protein